MWPVRKLAALAPRMRIAMRPLLLTVGLVVCPFLAVSQQPVSATLSLADAIALARQHNPAYRETIHDRSPAAWGVRNAWSSLWLPNVTASGGVAYAGPGEQNFLTSSFSQSVSTWSSSYSFLLDWTLNGQTLSEPGLRKAQLNAAQADVVGAETNLATAVTQQNPSLKALRERERAAGWGVKAASSSWGPSLALSAGWAGFTQKLSDINPTIASVRAGALADSTRCSYANNAWYNSGSGQPLQDCSIYAFTPPQEQAFRDQNGRYPLHFTPQPFQARLTVTIPLWGNFRQPLLVSQAKAQQQDLQESVRARGLQVQTDVSQAYLILETAFQTIAIQDTNRTAAREQLQLATERYRVGSGTFFELLDAQVAALRAETDYINAVYDYHKAVAALEAAVGKPLR